MTAKPWSTASPAMFWRTRSMASAASASTQRFGIDNSGERLRIANPHPTRERLKDPAVLDLLGRGEHARENSLQETLIERLTRFMLELEKGIELVGRQRHPQIGEQNGTNAALPAGASSQVPWHIGV